MLDLLILIIIVAGFITGLRRGFIVQSMHLLGFFVAAIVAYIYYKSLADIFVYWVPYPGFNESLKPVIGINNIDVDATFYRALAFAVIFFTVKIIWQILASIFNFITYLPVLHSLNRLLGAILGVIEFYVLLFIGLYILALLPLESIQSLMDGSIFAALILEHTPILTSLFQHWWYIYTK